MTIRTAMLTAVLLLCAMVSTAEERSIPLRNPQPEVMKKYEGLQWLDRQELRAAVAEITPRMHADIWTVHILRVMREHPELTVEQRSLIFEALGLIASGIFEIDRKTPEWITQGREPMKHLAERINAAFPPELARALMYDPRGSGTSKTPIDRLNRFRPAAQWFECTCSLYWQWDCSGRCVETVPSCWPYHTCGPWMSDTCDGVCS